MKWKKFSEFFFKGGFMGLADIVPGVSGGTIALITGIYRRLISAITSIDLKIPLHTIRGDFETAKTKFREIDFQFLIPLIMGIGVALLAASRVILVGLNQFPEFTYSFFFGLILASAFLIYKHIGKMDHLSVLITSGFGFMLAFIIVGQESANLPHTLPIIFIAGFIAICAMILPGISGSFMLLLVGQYEFMLSALHGLPSTYPIILIFLAGALISIFSFSRVLSYLLEKHRAHTMGFLAGLMLGALRLPFTKMRFDTYLMGSPLNISISVLFGIFGLLLVLLLSLTKTSQNSFL